MFERFTDRARRVLILSQGKGRETNSLHLGVEHIFYGLWAEGEGVAALVLKSSLTEEQIASVVEMLPDPGIASPPFTSGAKKLFETSLREALQLGHNYIGTEHMLLAMERVDDGVNLLSRLDLTPSDIRQQVSDLIGYEKPVSSGTREEIDYASLLADVENWFETLQRTTGRFSDEHPLNRLLKSLYTRSRTNLNEPRSEKSR